LGSPQLTVTAAAAVQCNPQQLDTLIANQNNNSNTRLIAFSPGDGDDITVTYPTQTGTNYASISSTWNLTLGDGSILDYCGYKDPSEQELETIRNVLDLNIGETICCTCYKRVYMVCSQRNKFLAKEIKIRGFCKLPESEQIWSLPEDIKSKGLELAASLKHINITQATVLEIMHSEIKRFVIKKSRTETDFSSTESEVVEMLLDAIQRECERHTASKNAVIDELKTCKYCQVKTHNMLTVTSQKTECNLLGPPPGTKKAVAGKKKKQSVRQREKNKERSTNQYVYGYRICRLLPMGELRRNEYSAAFYID